jgi:cystathionine gamma-synthase
MTDTDTTGQSLGSRSVHAGEERDPEGAIHTPLYNHSTRSRVRWWPT